MTEADTVNTIDTNDTEAVGNTKPLPKPSLRSRNWVWTWNNYDEMELEEVTKWSDTETQKFGIGQEVGESGTPHLQGFWSFKSARTWSSLTKKWPKIHLEKMRGKIADNIKYCRKDGKYVGTVPFKEKLQEKVLARYSEVKWEPWQQEILDLINTEPDSRSINWYWEPTGNVGKSFLAKYINLIHSGVIVSEGKSADIFNQINKMIEDEIEPKIIIADIPRSSTGYINYSALEKIKNGHLYSGKYEGGVCLFDYPHLIVFSNEPPEFKKASADRWKITRIGWDEMFKTKDDVSEEEFL